MSATTCLIVDDEPIARNILRKYSSQIAGLQVIAECGNAFEARKILQENKVDILFLDINMPVLDGIGFLKTLRVMPQVIFTTAYKEHAPTAFDLAACDYLVKPFSLERFMIAVDKAAGRISTSTVINHNEDHDQFFLKADGKVQSLKFHEILYAEAKGNYTKVITNKGAVLPAMSFTAFSQLLSSKVFIRIHRSYIVNKQHITSVTGNTTYINEVAIPIGSKYKDEFLRFLGL